MSAIVRRNGAPFKGCRDPFFRTPSQGVQVPEPSPEQQQAAQPLPDDAQERKQQG